MGLYINGIQYDILSPEGRLIMDISPDHIITNGAKSFSSDDCLLRDANGVYLTTTKHTQTLSPDDATLEDNENQHS